ncbi:hypothetical protein DPMN_106904 [Dreissena polymorpha]|uniref:Uncharacterized protein n=1 Tax=Dreissena polymorpha TaxID=45954 RepID=A0A9D4K628_DREPO|nr:hypothetical protein DPMN_106904 [Dreissena polymorpha]
MLNKGCLRVVEVKRGMFQTFLLLLAMYPKITRCCCIPNWWQKALQMKQQVVSWPLQSSPRNNQRTGLSIVNKRLVTLEHCLRFPGNGIQYCPHSWW